LAHQHTASKVGAVRRRCWAVRAIDIAAQSVDAIAALFERGMQLTAMVQDGEVQLMDAARTVSLRPLVRMEGAGGRA